MQISPMTKQTVLQLFSKTAVKRIVVENKIKKEDTNNPCYACIKGYTNSRIS
jgi:hypothetical protein